MYRWNPVRLQKSAQLQLFRAQKCCGIDQVRTSSSGDGKDGSSSSGSTKTIPIAVFGALVAGVSGFQYLNNSDKNKGTEKVKSVSEKAQDLTDEAATTTPEEPKAATEVNPASSSAVSQGIPVSTMNLDAVPDLPKHVTYLMVGAGTAAFAASRAIKARDPKAKILMIGAENRVPYMRPPLSKEMWFSEKVLADSADELKFVQWNGKHRSLFFEPKPFYIPYPELEARENGGISVVTGRRVVKIDSVAQKATLDNGDEIGYSKCLVATGGKAKHLDVLERNALFKSKSSTFRNAEDFFKLREILDRGKKIVIIGGGFLGSELACALGMKSGEKGAEIVQIFKESGNMGKVLPEYLSQWTTDRVRAAGVTVIPKCEIAKCSSTLKGRMVLHMNDGTELEVDHAVVALGIDANDDLAKQSQLEIDPEKGGYRVNAELEARSNLWVAGDAASFYDVLLGRRRVEHHDHAVVSGRLAGENMTGARKPYTHQSMFWSDLGPEIGYEAIGLVDAKLPTVSVFAKASKKDTPAAAVAESDQPMRSESENKKVDQLVVAKAEKGLEMKEGDKYGKGVVFYLKDDVVVGIVLWNVFGRMSLARRVLKENKKFEDIADLAKLFDIHSEQ